MRLLGVGGWPKTRLENLPDPAAAGVESVHLLRNSDRCPQSRVRGKVEEPDQRPVQPGYPTVQPAEQLVGSPTRPTARLQRVVKRGHLRDSNPHDTGRPSVSDRGFAVHATTYIKVPIHACPT